MNRLRMFLLSLLLLSPVVALAQHGSDAAAPASAVPAEAKQFDFLLGQWELDVHPKISSLVAMIHGTPRLVGTWKAWRAANGSAVEDEIRIVDSSGNPISLSRSVRIYDRAEAHWKVSGLDTTHGSTSEATGLWSAGEMHLDGHSTDAEGKPVLTRTRYYDITADSFRMAQDRSTDSGQNWDKDVVTIDAKRVAATAAH